jgi:hypothetical protein
MGFRFVQEQQGILTSAQQMEERHSPHEHLLTIRQFFVAHHADITLGSICTRSRCGVSTQAQQYIVEQPRLVQLQQTGEEVKGAGILRSTQQGPQGFALCGAGE